MTPVAGAARIYREIIPRLKGLREEEFWALFLSRGNVLIAKERLSSGGDSSTPVDVRKVVRRALEFRACGVILAHNHPSGDPMPGKSDMMVTGMIKKALASVDVLLLDHVVVCDDRYYSFHDEEMRLADAK